MKKFTLLLCLCLVAVAANSQTPAKTEQQQKKELKKAEKEAATKRIEAMIISRQFIFEISSMNDQSRNFLNTAAWVELSSSLNYIAFNSNKLVLQLETNSYQTSNWPFSSSPTNGTFSSYDVQELKGSNEGYLIKFHTEGRIGTYEITMNVSVSGKADIRMVQNNGVALKFNGILVPLGQSRIRPVFS